ncbi:putative bifunctional diguanylate cyclase/phosphodiesterase [Variovorax sp. HJSM1_2]|uniref:putative bifunctional diguanylate cyclase/phosphodiesterase n=1 Tax=Variovorax sp. HJSM1_2 TaxID=3366263 RepID=UPI003BD08680
MADMVEPAQGAAGGGDKGGASRVEMLQLLTDAVPALLAYFDTPSMCCRFANRAYAEQHGFAGDNILGKHVRDTVGPEVWAEIQPYVQRASQGERVTYQRERTRSNGLVVTLEVTLVPHFDATGVQCGAFVLMNDISHHARAEQALRESEERMRKFAEVTQEGIVFHQDSGITDVNAALLRMVGYTLDEVKGRRSAEFIAEAWRQHVAEQLRMGNEQPYEAALLHRSGREIPVEMVGKTLVVKGEIQRIAVVRDITARKEAQQRIEHMALHDALTGLPNRSFLNQWLEHSLATAQRHQSVLAVLFIDLDNFKTVNDSLGHHAGDQLLCEVASRLVGCVRKADVVARLGGDEFLIVLPDIGTRDSAVQVASKMLDTVKKVIHLEGHKVSVSPSIGIAMFPDDGSTVDELSRHADAAMYHAKDSGRGNYQFYTASMSQRAFRALHLEHQLREAIANKEFVLHYQPQWRLSDDKLVGVEALVRWQHPELGLLGPEDFVSFAEERGLIQAIGQWVLMEACCQIKKWHDAGWLCVPVAVNLSAIEFKQRDLVGVVTRALTTSGLAPAFLELEMTESVLMDSSSLVLDNLHVLKRLGVGLTIDDFGTGYSSLAYLKRYPIDKLKIDRSFVREMHSDNDDQAIASAVIQMARSLKLRTVAEGVEIESQADLLRGMGCDDFQGFLNAPPVDALGAQAWLGGRGLATA